MIWSKMTSKEKLKGSGLQEYKTGSGAKRNCGKEIAKQR